MSRPAGLRGRLPQKPPGKRFAIAYAHEYLAVTIPPPTYPIDCSRGIVDWGMLGNDQYGDCGEAGQLHYQMSTGADPSAFTTKQAIAEYLDYTQGQDSGVVLADFLLWLYRKGEILGFAPVDLSKRAQADSLMDIFNGLYVGVSLTNDAESLFSSGSEWTISHNERPNSDLGHCILQVGTDGETDTYVTWGAKQLATRAWTAVCVDEAWVIVTTQDQVAKMDMTLLNADLDSLGGTHVDPPLPVPDPTPVPDPQPPVPLPPPSGWGCTWSVFAAIGLSAIFFGVYQTLTAT